MKYAAASIPFFPDFSRKPEPQDTADPASTVVSKQSSYLRLAHAKRKLQTAKLNQSDVIISKLTKGTQQALYRRLEQIKTYKVDRRLEETKRKKIKVQKKTG